MSREAELTAILEAEPWLLTVLRTARALALPDWYIGAGAIRDVVWDVRFGSGFDPSRIEDIDLVYFDPSDLTKATEHAIEARLPRGWDVTNQAAVHTWFHEKFGGPPVEPLRSTVEGIATWPETATAVGVRLEPDGALTVAAPLGLDDLLDGVWRPNPVRVTPAEARSRFEKKGIGTRWPAVHVVT